MFKKLMKELFGFVVAFVVIGLVCVFLISQWISIRGYSYKLPDRKKITVGDVVYINTTNGTGLSITGYVNRVAMGETEVITVPQATKIWVMDHLISTDPR